MKKAAVLLLVFILMVLPLGACMDASEVNEETYAYMLGIDKGVADKLRFTVLIPTLKETPQSAIGGGYEQEGGDTTIISIDCPTLTSGMNRINSFLSRRMNYTHAEMLIIGEEIARQSITPFFEGMRVARQIRMDLSVIIVKGEASKFIEAFKPTLGKSVPGVITGLLNASEVTGYIGTETFLHVLHALKSSDGSATCTLGAVNDFSRYGPAGSEIERIEPGDYLAGQLPRIGGNPIELLGMVVFKGDRLAGELNLGETRALLMVKGEFVNGGMVIPDPLENGMYVSSRLQPSRSPYISVSTAGEVPVINIKIYLNGSIQNQQSEISYQIRDNRTLLEKTYAETIAKNIGDAVKKCQDLGCDIFRFHEAARKNFWTIPEWEAYNWRQKFPEAEVNIEVTFNMLRTGIVVDNNPVQNAEGGQ